MRYRAMKAGGVLAAVLLLAGPLTAQVNYDVDPKNSQDGPPATPVPDVDKGGVPGAVPPNDLGCWAATAANILGAAGWGVGANAQAKATNIYSDFITAFGNAALGYIDTLGSASDAAKWWVANIGLDSADAGLGYTPGCTYVNFRVKNQPTLSEADYNLLLGELARCQYVAVKWMIPDVGGHCVTMVGGNYGPNSPNFTGGLQQSVWHDSDSDGPGGVADEVRTNRWGGGGTWFLDMGVLGNVNDDWVADGYLTACPGVPKPASAIGNFDVHYFVGVGPRVDPGAPQKPYYTSTVQMLTTGDKYQTYHFDDGSIDPIWDPNATEPTLLIPNEVVSNMFKKLYIVVDFNDPMLVLDPFGNPIVPDIEVYDDADVEIDLALAEWASDKGSVLLTYIFDDQPAWEKVVFPGDEYVSIDKVGQQGYNVFEWNIATECVPEPATLGLLALGGLGLLLRRKR